MNIPFLHTDSKASSMSDGKRFSLVDMCQIFLVTLLILVGGSVGWCTIEEGIEKGGVWKDYRKPFEQDILVREVATVKVNLPKRFFRSEKVTLSVTTDATPHSGPKITIGEWEKDLGALLTPQEYFTTLTLTETLNLEIPTKHFRRGENDIQFYSATDRPEDQYIITRLEFAVSREGVEFIPPTHALEKVRIGLLTNLGEKYNSRLKEEVEKRPDRELIKIPKSIHCSNVDIETGKSLNREYKIDMLICVAYIYHYHHTKLIDISNEKLLELDPIRLDMSHGVIFGWEKELVSKQIGAVERMAEEISGAKVAIAAVPGEPEGFEKIRIGLLTSSAGTLLDPRAASFGRYIDYLTGEVTKRGDLEVVPLKEAISYHQIDIDAAGSLRQKHNIDMVIGVMNYMASGRGYEGHTKLIDLSVQRLIELEPVGLGGLATLDIAWEKKLLGEQIGPIQKMIDNISKQKILTRKAEERPEVTRPEPIETKKVRIGVLTELQKNLEREYFAYLKDTLERRGDSQLLLLVGSVTYDAPHPEAIEGLRQRHEIDMIIYVGTRAYSTGEMFFTGLVDTSTQRFVKIPGMYIKQENTYRWVKMLVKNQLEPIEEMIEEISHDEMTSGKS